MWASSPTNLKKQIVGTALAAVRKTILFKFSNPQALCASSFAKGAYTVSHGFADSLLF